MDRHQSQGLRPPNRPSYELPPFAHLCSSISPTSTTHAIGHVSSPSSSRSKKALTDKEMRNRTLQAERKRQWRLNQTPEQKERRKRMDADRKRRERGRLTEGQKAENRRRDAARKAAKRQKENSDSRGTPRASTHHRGDKYMPSSRHDHGVPPSSSILVRTASMGRFGDPRSDYHSYGHSSKHAPTSIQSLLN